MVGTRNKSAQMAKDATAWMRSNAPWQDITQRARKGLRAFVIPADSMQSDTFKDEMARARNADDMLMDELNTVIRQHRQAAYLKVVNLRHQGKMAEAKQFRKKVRKQKQYRTRSRVPVGKSMVSKLNRKKAGFLTPLVDVKFTHNARLPNVVWLEIAHGGRYGIISKAIEYWSPKFMTEVKRIANLKQYRDQLVLGEVSTQTAEEAFERHVAAQTLDRSFDDRSPYQPWSRERRIRRKVRRGYYNSEDAKEARLGNRKYNTQDKGLRKQVIQTPETMNIPTYRSK